MAESGGPYADVNSLYGPGVTCGWLLCCLALIIQNEAAHWRWEPVAFGYELFLILLYPSWAAIEATKDILTLDDGSKAHVEWPHPERFINKIYAPITVCTTWLWLIVPILMVKGSFIKSRSQAPPLLRPSTLEAEFARRDYAAALMASTSIITLFGTWIPFAQWFATNEFNSGRHCTRDSVPPYGHGLLFYAPFFSFMVHTILAYIQPHRRQGPESDRTKLRLAIVGLIWAASIVLFTEPARMNASEMSATGGCPNQELRSFWWIYSVIPKTEIPMSGDQIFTLVCGALNFAWSLASVITAWREEVALRLPGNA